MWYEGSGDGDRDRGMRDGAINLLDWAEFEYGKGLFRQNIKVTSTLLVVPAPAATPSLGREE